MNEQFVPELITKKKEKKFRIQIKLNKNSIFDRSGL